MARPKPPDEVWPQLEPLLDGALQTLPDRYRVPLLLCDLEGKTRKEAARQLGWPEGTVASRLARARDLLAKRLARHGLALGGAAVAAVLSQSPASACVPRSLIASVVKVAPLLAAGQAAVPGAISARVAALTKGVVKAMFMTRLKIAIGLCLMLAVLYFGATLCIGPAAAQPQKDAPGESTSTPAVAPPRAVKDVKKIQPRGGYSAGLNLRHVILDEVNAQGNTISATVQSGPEGKPAKLMNLLVAKDAQIIVSNKEVKLARLRTGMRVSLQLALDGEQLVVASIADDGRQDLAPVLDKVALDKIAAAQAALDKIMVDKLDEARLGLGQKKAVLDKTAQAAEERLARARANLEAARAQLQIAQKAVEAATSDLERKQAQANCEAVRADLARAEAEAAAAERQLIRTLRSYEENRAPQEK
jgi:hypothetical protein